MSPRLSPLLRGHEQHSWLCCVPGRGVVVFVDAGREGLCTDRELRTQPEGELSHLSRVQPVEVEHHLLGRNRILLDLPTGFAARHVYQLSEVLTRWLEARRNP